LSGAESTDADRGDHHPLDALEQRGKPGGGGREEIAPGSSSSSSRSVGMNAPRPPSSRTVITTS